MELLRRIHRYVGLLLLLPLILEGLSGTILTVASVWPVAAIPDDAASANAILVAAAAAAPEGAHARLFRPGDPATVMFSTPGPGRGFVPIRIDPVSLRPIAVGGTQGGFVDFNRRLHATLLLPGFAGRSILGWEAVGLVLLIVVGVPLWWPRRGQIRAAFMIAPRARGFRFHRRLHGAVGIWCLPLMLLTSVTGAALSFPQTTRSLLGIPAANPMRSNNAIPNAPSGEPMGPVDLDRAIALARDSTQGATLRMVALPTGPGEPLRLVMASATEPSEMLQVTTTPDGSRLLVVQRPSDLSAGERAMRLMRSLHEGEFLGPAGPVLTALGGVALALFSVTGAAMWLARRRNRTRLAAQRRPVLQDAD